MSTTVERYREHCEQDPDIHLFSQAFWLDAVCGAEKWDAVLVEKNGEVVGSMPYYPQRQYGFQLLTMPLLTQLLGPRISYHGIVGLNNRYSHEKAVLSELIEQLPACAMFKQHFHPSVTNWLPFHWQDYRQTTRYTYAIEDISNPQAVFKAFDYGKKYDINKATKQVTIHMDLSAEDFYNYHRLALQKQGKRISYSMELFNRLYQVVYKRDQGRTIYAVDGLGNVHSALFIVWDCHSGYNLISAIDPDYRNSGSFSLLVWRAIQMLSGRVLRFDFEGSMVEGVERSYRKFGATQVPYFCVTKVHSRMLQGLIALRDLCC